MNLIPETSGKTPNYWCTWGIQNYSLTEVANMASWTGPASNLNERLLFDDPGWAARYFDKVRGDLYILFDAGWDVPAGMDGDKERWRFSPFLPDPVRFPSCTGAPAVQLRKLDELCKDTGWRGAGLWGAPQIPGEGKDGFSAHPETARTYWRERARWTHEAGIEYWKIDTGHHGDSAEYRRMLTYLARAEAPGLLLEHASVSGPFNDVAVPWNDAAATNTGRYHSPDGTFQRAVDFLAFSDILRTYDVTPHLSVVTSLDRVAQLLATGKAEIEARGLVNCEDEPYLAAGLGCVMGILRHPLWLPRPNQDYNPAHVHRRIDEITRAVRWQRLAPAFGVNQTLTILDDHVLFDKWLYRAGDCWAWWVTGQEIVQGAPARVARGMSLPVISAQGEPPFVVASRHPDGAVALATLSRTSSEIGIFLPLADVTIEIGGGTDPIGIFGKYRSLTLNLTVPLGARRVWAQDLAGDEAVDISGKISRGEKQIILPGELITQVGYSAATPGDLSEPGLVLVLEET
jgi:hypothetical protein